MPNASTLKRLPEPELALFGMRPPWALVTSRVVATLIPVEIGLLNVWVWRGVAPPAMPATWFKGRSRVFRVSDVLSFLAGRHGTTFDPAHARAKWFKDQLGLELEDNDRRTFARRLAACDGPRLFERDGVRFTGPGWNAYLADLADEPQAQGAPGS